MKNKSGLIFKLNETYSLNEVSVQFKLNEVNVQFTYTAKQPASPYTCLNGIFLYLPSQQIDFEGKKIIFNEKLPI